MRGYGPGTPLRTDTPGRVGRSDAKTRGGNFEERKRAEAIEVKAAAEAKSIEMKGRAEGTALAETGKGEAEAIKAQGEAYNAMNNTFILTQQYIAILLEIARAVAEPLTKVDKITMYGEGNASKLVGDTTNTMSQLNEAFEKALGIDLSSLINSVAGGNAAGAAIAKHMGETADAAGGRGRRHDRERLRGLSDARRFRKGPLRRNPQGFSFPNVSSARTQAVRTNNSCKNQHFRA